MKKIKKVISVILCSMLVLSISAFSAYANENVNSSEKPVTTNNAAESVKESEVTPNYVTTRTVTVSSTNVRTGAGTNYKSLGLLYRGDSFRFDTVNSAYDSSGNLWYYGVGYQQSSGTYLTGWVIFSSL